MASDKVENEGSSSEPVGPVNEERRDALRRVARFGAYTAPTLLAMLASEKAANAS